MSSKSSDLPYRPCVGIAVFNRDGLVWIGRRIDGPKEPEGMGKWWQMPQGGIDDGEDLVAAARRELYEETSIRSVSVIGESPDWYLYDLPDELIGKAWGGKYRGQRIKYVAFRFDGDESEIDVKTPGGGHDPEFTEWRWESLARLPDLIIPFKRPVYDQIAAAFAQYAAHPSP
ncbi:MAG: RNA pyrophosphohydrolase [Bauldia sp.]|nr:RNA pyrophosphohydrolase [Bauldia sp.]